MTSRDKQTKLAKLAELKRIRDGGKRIWKVSGIRHVSYNSIAGLIQIFV